jgi:23S rRNA (adenine2503-C2)-methyltransferase
MSSARPDLAELDIPELEAALESRGYERFHARQLYRWIYRRGVTDLDRMTDLSRTLRERLAAEFTLSTPTVVGDERSLDGTRKLVLELGDRKRIEAVFIPDTPSISTIPSTSC